MSFPAEIVARLTTEGRADTYNLALHGGITVLIGPNGSGKTQLMRAARNSLTTLMERLAGVDGQTTSKKVKFVSAGRIGTLEQYRSDSDGHRGGQPLYDDARYGSRKDVARRHNYETLQGDILTLSQRPDILVKIRERLRKLFGRDVLIEWDAGSLKLSFMRLDSGNSTYSSGREASGLIHLVGLLTALYDDEVGALLVDEPEVSLHPQLQSFVLKEMTGIAGYPEFGTNKKIIIISTHSTEFIRLNAPNDIPNLIFCSAFGATPIQMRPDANELQSRKIKELISRMGQEHKLALFARSPVLVEGPADAVICGALAAKLSMHLEAGGAQILPVIGKGEFPTVLKLFRMMGKSPVVLADCDALADGTELANSFFSLAQGAAIANENGYGTGQEFARTVYADFCKLADSHWPEIATIAERSRYFADENVDDELKRKRRAALVAVLSAPPEELSSLLNAPLWLAMRTRANALLCALERLGCFVLRKGTIEDYFVHTDLAHFSSKTEAAANEAIEIQEEQPSRLEEAFGDVIRCMTAASSAQKLNEGEVLLDVLLACVAPLQARLISGTSGLDPNQLARSTNGELSQLFDFSWGEGAVVVDLKSKVLNVQGFPLTIRSTDNLVQVCRIIVENVAK